MSCVLVSPRSKEVNQVTAHSRVVKRNLCSSLCSAPVIAEDPPDPVVRWILGACATWPKPKGTPDIQASLLSANLTPAGAMQLQDFESMTSTEAMAIWPRLGETPMGFVDHLFSCLPRALGAASAESTRHRQLFNSFTKRRSEWLAVQAFGSRVAVSLYCWYRRTSMHVPCGLCPS